MSIRQGWGEIWQKSCEKSGSGLLEAFVAEGQTWDLFRQRAWECIVTL